MASAACCALESPGIRSSFDLCWGGLSHAELLSSVGGDAYNRQQRATSLQLEREDTTSLASAADLLQLQQLQQALLQQQAAAAQQSQAEDGIDVQIQHLLELKAQLRRTKQAAAQQQQQQVILEDMALGDDAGNSALDAAAASALFASSGLVTPMQSER